MKKIVCVLLAGLMLAGCRNGNGKETETPAAEDSVLPAETAADTVEETEKVPAEIIVEEGIPGEMITGSPTPPEDETEPDAPGKQEVQGEPDAPEKQDAQGEPEVTEKQDEPSEPAGTEEPLTWYLYRYTTGTGCFADTVMRPEHSGYIQFGSFCEDPWTLIDTYTPDPEQQNLYIQDVTDGRYIIRDGEWFLYDAMMGTKEPLDFLPADAATVYALTKDTQEIIGYVVQQQEDGDRAYYDLTAGKWITEYVWDSFSYSGSGDYVSAASQTEAGDDYEVLIHRLTGEEKGRAVFADTLCNENACFFLMGTKDVMTHRMRILTEEGVPVSELEYSFASLTEDGALLAVPSGTEEDPFRRYFQVYDKNGILIHTSGQYGNVLFAYRDWVVVTEENRLLVLDREENVLVNFGKWSRDMTLHWSFSGWKENYAQTGDVPREYKYRYFDLNENGDYIGRITYQCPDGLYLLAEDTSIPVGGLGRAKWYFWNPEDGKAGMLSFSALLNVYTIPEI